MLGVVGNRKKGFAELRALVENPTSWPVPVVAPPVEPGSERESWTHSMLTLAHYVAPQENVSTSKVDKVLLHPVFGTLFFFLIMFLFFQVIFTVAAPFQGWIEDFFSWLGELSAEHITNPLLSSFVNTALIGGVGGVLVFVPQILLLFYMEMPPYRIPTGKTVLSDMWKSTSIFLRKVGRIILVSTIVIWALINFSSQQHTIEEHHMDKVQAVQYTTDHSVAASTGKAVEPVVSPLGFDWRITIGLIGSLAAREVFVATMG